LIYVYIRATLVYVSYLIVCTVSRYKHCVIVCVIRVSRFEIFVMFARVCPCPYLSSLGL
jgi:hypothetical protein